MVVLVTCKNVEDPIKNEGARVVSDHCPLGYLFLVPKKHSQLCLKDRDILIV